MKKINRLKFWVGLCILPLFVSCDFEEVNTNQFEMSEGEGAMDGFEVGALITTMQRTVIPVGTQADDTDVMNIKLPITSLEIIGVDSSVRTIAVGGILVVIILLITCLMVG